MPRSKNTSSHPRLNCMDIAINFFNGFRKKDVNKIVKSIRKISIGRLRAKPSKEKPTERYSGTSFKCLIRFETTSVECFIIRYKLFCD